MSDAMQRVTRARSALVLDQPWFGVLSLRLQMVETAGIGTMRTDGTKVEFDPAAVDSWSDTELRGVIAHEVMHCALRHMYRVGARDMKRWNKACDLAINPLLQSDGFVLPQDALLDPQFAGMSAEAIYAKLEAEEQQNGDEPQDGEGNAPAGGFTQPQPGPGKPDADDSSSSDASKGDDNNDADAGGDASGADQPADMSETDWEVAVEQATAVAAKRGHVSSDVQRTVQAARESATSWKDVLWEFVQQITPSDYSWQRPNRRHIASGLYLPGVVKEGTPRLVIVADTSGSIDSRMLEAFAAEMRAIMQQCSPEAVDVVYCDAAVKAVQTFTPDDELTIDKLTPKGGGGTAFQPAFDHINAMDEQPAACIYLTDLDGDQPREPDYPVLWVVPEWVSKRAPFGKLVKFTA